MLRKAALAAAIQVRDERAVEQASAIVAQVFVRHHRATVNHLQAEQGRAGHTEGRQAGRVQGTGQGTQRTGRRR